jgi:hypothetical protein
MKTNIGVICCILVVNFLAAQSSKENKEVFAASPQSEKYILESPKNLTASDGLYDRYVLIHWESTGQATQYKVFRTDKLKGGTLQEISKSWQQSTWLCDYSASPGVQYYYTVMASNGRDNSRTSPYDKGFVKPKDIAEEQNNRLSSTDKNEKFANGNTMALMIDAASSDNPSYKSGETANLAIKLINIFDTETTQAEIRCYLSKDAIFDFDDKLLNIKSFASVPAGANLSIKETVKIPDNTLVGNYYILIVSATQRAVLSSRVQPLRLNIVE